MIYLDYQATAPTDARVVEAMLPWLTTRVGNPHSTSHSSGREAKEAVEAARAKVAILVNAMPEEVIFTSGATEATNIALRGILPKGKSRVVTSTIEHSCVRDTLDEFRRSGTQVSEIRVDPYGIIDLDKFSKALGSKTNLVTIMTANNEVGTVQPIAAVGHACRDAGVLFHTDAAQAVGKVALDVVAANIDLMSISGHKLYGPQGIGALYIRRDVFPRMKPIMTGGGQERGLRPGTLPTALCVGFGEACAIAKSELESDSRQALALRKILLDTLAHRLMGVQVNGCLDERLPGNLNIWFEGVDGDALLARLPDLAMSMGSACHSASIEPSHVLIAMGLTRDQAE